MAEDIISKLKLLNKNSGGWGGVVVLGVDAFGLFTDLHAGVTV